MLDLRNYHLSSFSYHLLRAQFSNPQEIPFYNVITQCLLHTANCLHLLHDKPLIILNTPDTESKPHPQPP